MPPRWTLAVEDVQYLLTFAIMLAVALITAPLTAGFRQQLQIPAAHERDARALDPVAPEAAKALRDQPQRFITETGIGYRLLL